MFTNIKIEEPNSKRGLLARLNSFLKKNYQKIDSIRLILPNFKNFVYKIIFKFTIFTLIILPLQTTHPQDTTDDFLAKNNYQFLAVSAIKSLKNTNSTTSLIKEKSETDFAVNQIKIAQNQQNIKKENIKNMWVTAYSSSLDETDDDPFITASGKFVQDGFVATNILPLGTKIKIPEIFGEKIFTVEDRMHWRKQNVIDVWMDSKDKAIKFGAYYTKIIILENQTNNFAQINLTLKNLD